MARLNRAGMALVTTAVAVVAAVALWPGTQAATPGVVDVASTSDVAPAPAPPRGAPATPAATPTPTPTPTGGAPIQEDADEQLPEGTQPEPLPPGQEEELLDLAVGAAAAFARPDGEIDRGKWWQGFSRYLTEQAASDYQDVDPSAVPYREVHGEAVIRSTSHLVVLVDVSTDAGTWTVHIVTVDPPKVSRLSPRNQGGR